MFDDKVVAFSVIFSEALVAGCYSSNRYFWTFAYMNTVQVYCGLSTWTRKFTFTLRRVRIRQLSCLETIIVIAYMLAFVGQFQC